MIPQYSIINLLERLLHSCRVAGSIPAGLGLWFPPETTGIDRRTQLESRLTWVIFYLLVNLQNYFS